MGISKAASALGKQAYAQIMNDGTTDSVAVAAGLL